MQKNILLLEIKDFINKKNIALLLATVLILAYFLQIGINHFKEGLEYNEKFQEAELLKAESQNTLTMYGSYGILLNTIPNVASVFAATSGFENLMGFVDNGARLNVWENKKGKLSLERLDFSKAIYLICLWAIFMGHFYRVGYLKYFISDIGFFRTFRYFIVAKAIILLLIVLSIYIIMFIQLLLNGILFLNWYFFVLLSTPFLVSLFFLVISTLVRFAQIEQEKFRPIFLFMVCLFLFVIPYIINEILMDDNGDLKMEIDKVRALMGFELEMEKKYGPSKVEKSGKPAPDEIKKEIERWKKEGNKKIEDQEGRVLMKLESNVKVYHLISALFPTSLLNVTYTEICAIGHRGNLEFHKFTLKTKKEFVSYYLNGKFSKGNQKDQIPFKGINFWSSRPFLPYYFVLGIMGIFFYFLVGLTLAYKNFKSYFLYSNGKFDELELNLKKGIMNYFLTRLSSLKSYILFLFITKSEIINSNSKIPGFFYLPNPDELPRVLPKIWGNILNTKDDVTSRNSWDIFFNAALKSGKVILCFSALSCKNDENIRQINRDLYENNAVFIEIGEDRYQWEKFGNPLFWHKDPTVEVKKYKECF